MFFLRSLIVTTSIFIPVTALAHDTYFGTSARALATYGFEGRNVEALGQDLFVGRRFVSWFSFEGYYSYQLALNDSPLPGLGAACNPKVHQTWYGERFRWHTAGVRTWFHALHRRVIDVSFAAFIAGGFGIDRLGSCYVGDVAERIPVFETGTGLGIELRPLEWLGVRVAADAGINVPLGIVIQGCAWLGVVFRPGLP